jgi:DNA repair protein RadC
MVAPRVLRELDPETSDNGGLRATHVPIYRCVLVRDKSRKVLIERAKMSTPYQAASIVAQLTEDSPVEKLVCIYLDAHGRIIGAEVVATGWENGINCTPSTVLRGAIIHCATGIIVGHNHPSGDPSPTQADVDMTTALLVAAKAVGIDLLDHVVVAHGNGHRSIRDGIGEEEW